MRRKHGVVGGGGGGRRAPPPSHVSMKSHSQRTKILFERLTMIRYCSLKPMKTVLPDLKLKGVYFTLMLLGDIHLA